MSYFHQLPRDHGRWITKKNIHWNYEYICTILSRFCNKLLVCVMFMIYALFLQNFVVAIHTLFKQIFLDWKAESADFLLLECMACRSMKLMNFQNIFKSGWLACVPCQNYNCIASVSDYLVICMVYWKLQEILFSNSGRPSSSNSQWERYPFTLQKLPRKKSIQWSTSAGCQVAWRKSSWSLKRSHGLHL